MAKNKEVKEVGGIAAITLKRHGYHFVIDTFKYYDPLRDFLDTLSKSQTELFHHIWLNNLTRSGQSSPPTIGIIPQFKNGKYSPKNGRKSLPPFHYGKGGSTNAYP